MMSRGWAFNREYKSILGTYKKKRILVMSTGIGAPSAGIGVEELHNVNVKKVIRVGSAGAMQSGIGLGELIIGEGVVRDDGLTQKYVPGIYPAVPAFRLMALAHKYAPRQSTGLSVPMMVSTWTIMLKTRRSGQVRESSAPIWNPGP